MAKQKPGYYAVIPAEVRYDAELPPNAKLLYGEISALLSDEGYCYASNQYFADLFQLTTRTVSDLVAKLQDRGHISVVIRHNDKGKVVRREIRCTVSLRHAQPVEEIFHTPRKNLPGGIEENFQYTNTSNTNLNIPRDAQVAVSGGNEQGQATAPEPFDQFWSAYPLKKSKKDARKAFAKVKAPLDTLLAALERQKKTPDWTKDGGRYIPYASTWLNGERWEDEVKTGPKTAAPVSSSGSVEEWT